MSSEQTALTESISLDLQTLRKQYFALVPAYLLHIPGGSILSQRSAQDFLADLATTTVPPQPESSYRRRFWKRLLPDIEACADDDGVDERIYEAVADTMCLASSSIPAASAKTFIYSNPEKRLTLFEEQVAIQAGTTGLRTWTAALHLAHHLLSTPSLLSSPVLELGAGTGFLSGILALEGYDVIATDLGDGGESVDGVRQTPLGRLRENLATNNLEVLALPLDWSHALDETRPEEWETVSRPARNIVAADVIYDPDIVPLLVSAIDTLLTGETCALVAATIRNVDTFNLFLSTCSSRGLNTQILDLEPMSDSNPTFWDTALDRGTRVEIVRITK